MEIKDGWKIRDVVSGLTIEVVAGDKFNRLHIESLGPAPDGTMNRDFYFTKDGKFDGTGSKILETMETETDD